MKNAPVNSQREKRRVNEAKKGEKKRFIMGKLSALMMVIGIICACTCGGRTECGNHAQISLLTSIHDDPSCRKLSAKGVLLYEAAKLLTEIHNNKTTGYDIGKLDRSFFHPTVSFSFFFHFNGPENTWKRKKETKRGIIQEEK